MAHLRGGRPTGGRSPSPQWRGLSDIHGPRSSGHRRSSSSGLIEGNLTRLESPPAAYASPSSLPSKKVMAIPLVLKICSALASTWFAIRLLTLYPSLFLMFCYPVLLAAILEPMKMALWKFMWFCCLQVADAFQHVVRAVDKKDEVFLSSSGDEANMDCMVKLRRRSKDACPSCHVLYSNVPSTCAAPRGGCGEFTTHAAPEGSDRTLNTVPEGEIEIETPRESRTDGPGDVKDEPLVDVDDLLSGSPGNTPAAKQKLPVLDLDEEALPGYDGGAGDGNGTSYAYQPVSEDPSLEVTQVPSANQRPQFSAKAEIIDHDRLDSVDTQLSRQPSSESGPRIYRRVGSKDTGDFHHLPINQAATPLTFLSATAKYYLELIVKKVLLVVAILTCLLTAGRVVVILGRIVLSTAEQIAQDFGHYQAGAAYRVEALKHWIAALTEAKLGRRIQMPVNILIVSENQILEYANHFAVSASSYVFQQVVPQTCITTLFLVFLMWNPVKAEGRRKDVLDLCSEYVKVKSVLSTTLGFLVGTSLWLCGLELYYAAGLLVAVANFIPNGALLCSTLPCIFAFFDDRRRINQVISALLLQIGLINSFAFIIEPIFFGAAIEMHPIPAILGVTFFGYVWGMAGMIISIPLLGAFRLVLAAMASKAPEDEREGFQAMQDFIEGRWTTQASFTLEDGETLDDWEQEDHLVTEVDLEAEESVAQPAAPYGVVIFYRDTMESIRFSYHRRKVQFDGILYMSLVYFLFSSWSDRVFGIYSDPEANPAVMTPAANASMIVN